MTLPFCDNLRETCPCK